MSSINIFLHSSLLIISVSHYPVDFSIEFILFPVWRIFSGIFRYSNIWFLISNYVFIIIPLPNRKTPGISNDIHLFCRRWFESAYYCRYRIRCWFSKLLRCCRVRCIVPLPVITIILWKWSGIITNSFNSIWDAFRLFSTIRFLQFSHIHSNP